MALSTMTTLAAAESLSLPPVGDSVAPVVPNAKIYWQLAISGNTVIPTRELESVAVPYLGRAISDAEIEALRQELTQHYVKLGFINSGVLTQAETTRDGILGFRVIEGKIGNIHFKGLAQLAPEYLAGRIAESHEVFNLNVLQERMQLLLSDPVVGRLNARVVPGATLGFADIQLEVAEARRYQLTAFANNHQTPSTGSHIIGLLGELRNLTGWGDVLNLTLQGSDGQDGYGLAWQFPVSARGTVVNLAGYSSAASIIEEPLRMLDIDSRSEGWELGISHPLIQSMTQRLVFGLAYIDRESRTMLAGVPFAFATGAADGSNRASEWRFSQEYMLRMENAAYALRSTFTSGKNNAAMASAIERPPGQYYRTWVGQVQAAFPAFMRGQMLIRGSTQWSNANLVSMAQYSIGGASTVRGYRENHMVRDRGVNVSIEYRHLLKQDTEAGFRLVAFPFIDYGEGWNAGRRSDAISSVGVGLAMNYGGLDVELAVAQQIVHPAVKTSGALQDSGIHFQVRYRFF